MAIKEMCWAATEAVLADKNILILSDRTQGRGARAPCRHCSRPAAVHHHLVRQGLRMQTGLVVETGEAREVHHFCALAGYGAEAVNPLRRVRDAGRHPRPQRACRTSTQGCREELHQGESARASSRSCPRWASRRINPIAARRSLTRSGLSSAIWWPAVFHRNRDHDRRVSAWPGRFQRRRCCGIAVAYGDNPIYRNMLDVGGIYQFAAARRGARMDVSANIAALQHAVRGNLPEQVSRIRADDQRPGAADADDPGAGKAQAGRRRRLTSLTSVEPASRDRKAFRHRGNELRLNQPGGAHHAWRWR